MEHLVLTVVPFSVYPVNPFGVALWGHKFIYESKQVNIEIRFAQVYPGYFAMGHSFNTKNSGSGSGIMVTKHDKPRPFSKFLDYAIGGIETFLKQNNLLDHLPKVIKEFQKYESFRRRIFMPRSPEGSFRYERYKIKSVPA